MLKKSLIGAAACVCLAMGASAQQTAVKVGTISVQGAIIGTKDGQKASQELESKVQPKRKDFETRQNELAQLQDQLNKGGAVMNDEKRNQLTRDVDEKKKRLERDMQDANESLQAEQQRVLQGLGQRVMAVIEKYAKDNGYTMILDTSNPNTPILWASSGVDITQDIVQLYDKTSSNGGPAATPGVTPKTGGAAPKTSGSPSASAPMPGTPR